MTKKDTPAARGGRGGERGASRGTRGGRGRGGASRGGYSNEDGTLNGRRVLMIAFKDRDAVIAQRERNPDEPRPRGRGRGARGGRGREFDRHSATGRVYVLN